MADDVASLGFQIDTRQLQAATGELRKFNQEAQATEQRSGAIAAAARRNNVTYEEMAARYKAAGIAAKGHAEAEREAATAAKAGGDAAKTAAVAKKQLSDEVNQLRAGLRTLSREAFLLPGPLGQMARVLGGVSYGLTPLTVGITAGVAGFAALSAAVSVSIIKYAEFEAQQARVANALAATGRPPGLAPSIERNAQVGAGTGTQSVADLRAASLELLRFRDVSSNVFPQVMQAARDVAAVGFVDLKNATEGIGKALQDPTKAGEQFAAMGLRLSDSAQRAANEAFGLGNRAGATKIILGELSRQVGGSDARAADTLAGAWGRATNGFQSYVEAAGKVIAENLRLKSGLDGIAEVIDFIQKNGRALGSAATLGIVSPRAAPTDTGMTGDELAARRLQSGSASFDQSGFTGGDIAGKERLNNAEALAQSTARAKAEADKLREAWGVTTEEIAKALQATQDQATIAAAVTGQQQIAAQFAVTYAQAIRDGATAEEAAALAAGQRAVTYAQLNADADRQLKTLQQQGQLLQAESQFEKDRIAAAQTYQNLLEKGVDSEKARAVAGQQLRNADLARQAQETADAEREAASAAERHARANEAAAVAAERNAQAAAEAQRRWDAAAQALKFIPFYLLDAMGLMDKLFNSNQGGKSQFDPAGYEFKIKQSVGGAFGGGSITSDADFDRALAENGSVAGVVDKILSGGLTGGASFGNRNSGGTLDQAKLGILQRAIDLLPDQQKVGAIQREIAVLQSQPQTLAGTELINQLNEKLKQLTDATNENTAATSAMTDVLSPYYSSDPRRTHLGFRAFAGGGIMTPYGELPLRNYDGGGIANSPQISMFGEGSTPEAYVPVPNGRIPVEMRQPANSNAKQDQRPIQVSIVVQGNADASTVDALKRTAYQQAQGIRRALG